MVSCCSGCSGNAPAGAGTPTQRLTMSGAPGSRRSLSPSRNRPRPEEMAGPGPPSWTRPASNDGPARWREGPATLSQGRKPGMGNPAPALGTAGCISGPLLPLARFPAPTHAEPLEPVHLPPHSLPAPASLLESCKRSPTAGSSPLLGLHSDKVTLIPNRFHYTWTRTQSPRRPGRGLCMRPPPLQTSTSVTASPLLLRPHTRVTISGASRWLRQRSRRLLISGS